jgi:hypothetical protein
MRTGDSKVFFGDQVVREELMEKLFWRPGSEENRRQKFSWRSGGEEIGGQENT